ncbi:hypothetical protein ACL_0225 [Acholeplasma laidlawii PG-8A]|uniref:Uncharacterized protein n=1 Tax=Acholeplasma laidlawii (strain PG-8A) TaxID=441768 RepID=A9NES1_ACHLI|nr:hypothetical protein ACL_0225 [Acholeplasma laidlawii PG-8A]
MNNERGIIMAAPQKPAAKQAPAPKKPVKK